MTCLKDVEQLPDDCMYKRAECFNCIKTGMHAHCVKTSMYQPKEGLGICKSLSGKKSRA